MWCMDGVYIIDKLILCVEYLNTSCIISLCRKSKRLCYSHVCVQIKCTSLVCFLHIYWQKYLKALCHSFASWKKPTNWNLHLCCVHYYLFCTWVIGEFNLLYVWMTTGDIDCPWNCVLSVNTAPFHPFQKANSLFFFYWIGTACSFIWQPCSCNERHLETAPRNEKRNLW